MTPLTSDVANHWKIQLIIFAASIPKSRLQTTCNRRFAEHPGICLVGSVMEIIIRRPLPTIPLARTAFFRKVSSCPILFLLSTS
jgi:hypothetical protein